LATAPSDPDVAYTDVYTGNILGPTQYYGLYKTIDAGLTWAPAGSDSPRPILGITVDPLDAQTLYVRTAERFLKSTTGGKTFTDMPWDQAALGAIPYGFAVDPVNSNIMYAAVAAGVIRSVDGGQSWQVLPPSPFSPIYNSWLVGSIMVDPNRHNDVLVAAFFDGAYKLTVAADLSLSAEQPAAPAAAGSTLQFNYSAANKGPYDSTAVKLVVQLPASATNVAGHVDGGECTAAGSVVTCTAPVLRNGATASVVVNAVAAAAGDFTAQATLTADQPDPDTSNNTVTTSAPAASSNPGGSGSPGSGTSGSSSAGASGGGGAFSAPWLLGLALLMLARMAARRVSQPARLRLSGAARPTSRSRESRHHRPSGTPGWACDPGQRQVACRL